MVRSEISNSTQRHKLPVRLFNLKKYIWHTEINFNALNFLQKTDCREEKLKIIVNAISYVALLFKRLVKVKEYDIDYS